MRRATKCEGHGPQRQRGCNPGLLRVGGIITEQNTHTWGPHYGPTAQGTSAPRHPKETPARAAIPSALLFFHLPVRLARTCRTHITVQSTWPHSAVHSYAVPTTYHLCFQVGKAAPPRKDMRTYTHAHKLNPTTTTSCPRVRASHRHTRHTGARITRARLGRACCSRAPVRPFPFAPLPNLKPAGRPKIHTRHGTRRPVGQEAACRSPSPALPGAFISPSVHIATHPFDARCVQAPAPTVRLSPPSILRSS